MSKEVNNDTIESDVDDIVTKLEEWAEYKQGKHTSCSSVVEAGRGRLKVEVMDEDMKPYMMDTALNECVFGDFMGGQASVYNLRVDD